MFLVGYFFKQDVRIFCERAQFAFSRKIKIKQII